MRVDSVQLAPDVRSVRLDLVGRAEFDVNDPCSAAYEAVAEIVNPDELILGVYELAHPTQLQQGMACADVGYQRTLVVRLDEPFTGTQVIGPAGNAITVDSPAD